MIQRAYYLHNVCRFLIFAQSCGSSLVDTWNVDDGFLVCIKHLTDVIQIRAMIEVVAKNKILQILIAIQLLIVIISNRKELGFILWPQNWYAITTKITTRHSDDMT